MKSWPRKRKLLLCVPILLISLFFIGSISNWRSPTLEIAIRRKEKQQLVGPSEIIGRLDYDYGHLILGKTEHGWITYEYIDDLGWDSAELRYFPKEENVTIFCTDFSLRTDGEDWLPIFVFPETTKASTAEMTLSIAGKESTVTYQLEGKKTDGGYWLFSMPMKERQGEHFWLLQQAITGAWQGYILTGTVEIHIDFYNRSGNLIDTYSKTVTK